MKSLNIDKIASQILPKDFDSHVGINYITDSSNFNYLYFYNRNISSFQFDSTQNPSIKYVHNIIEKSLELKLDINSQEDIKTSLIYHPYLLHEITFVQQFKNLIQTKHFSIPITKFEIDSINGINFFLKNKILPFAEQKNSNLLKINVENTYASNILCSNIQFKFPYFKFSIFTNTIQSVFQMKTKFNRLIKLKSCLSFIFDHNKFVTALPEVCLKKPLKPIFSLCTKNQSLPKICYEKDKLGLKFDSDNKYFLLRHENHLKTRKGNLIDCGLSISYRPNNLRTASSVKYTTEDHKWSFSLGKTEDTKLNTRISRQVFGEAVATAGFCIGPIRSKYPSKSFCFEINFYNNE